MTKLFEVLKISFLVKYRSCGKYSFLSILEVHIYSKDIKHIPDIVGLLNYICDNVLSFNNLVLLEFYIDEKKIDLNFEKKESQLWIWRKNIFLV